MAGIMAKVRPFAEGLLMRLVDRLFEFLLFVANLGRRSQRIPPTSDPLLLAPAVVIADAIRHGRVSSEAVIRAYWRRIRDVEPLVNAVVDERFDAALKEARAADELVQRSSPQELERTKQLLGVPFVTKCSVMVQGLVTDAGLPAWRGQRADYDADSVRLMREAGAIPVATTNTPELCLWTESFNQLHGRTNNPHDTRRTAGGSSGGVASLLSAGGAILGIGTDIGGSIRLPSAYCGTFGHMATPGAVPCRGHRGVYNDEFLKLHSAGPMTRYAGDLMAMLKVMLSSEARLRLQLEKTVDLSKLRIFYADDEGCKFFSRIHPDIREAVRKVCSYLGREFGSPVERIRLEEASLTSKMWGALFTASKCEPISRFFTDDDGRPINPWLEFIKIFCGNSTHTFPAVLVTLLERHSMFKTDSDSTRYYLTMVRNFKEHLLSTLRDDAVLIYPAALGPAPFHNEHVLRPGQSSLTALANIAGCPSTAIPIGMTPNGRPLGVQVMAAPNMDRLCLTVAAELEKGFGGWKRPFDAVVLSKDL
ncbi:fatty-acid amide hydrolase 2-A-like [Amblyomma americanum]